MPTTPVRVPAGFNNVPSSHPLSMLGLLSPVKYQVFHEDFHNYTAADWTVTETQAGATQALVAGPGGLLLLTNSAADNDVSAIQLPTAVFKVVAGKQAWFYARINQISEDLQTDWAIGLQNANTTFIDASVTDGIYFQKDDGDAQIDFYCRKNATTGSTSLNNVATFVKAVEFTLGWYFDGIGAVKGYVNDVHVGTLVGSSAYLPDTNLTLVAAQQNGDAVARTMTIDSLTVIIER